MNKLAPSAALLALATLIACAPESSPDAEATVAANAPFKTGDFVEGQVILTLKAPDFHRKDAVSMRGQRLPVDRAGRIGIETRPE